MEEFGTVRLACSLFEETKKVTTARIQRPLKKDAGNDNEETPPPTRKTDIIR